MHVCRSWLGRVGTAALTVTACGQDGQPVAEESTSEAPSTGAVDTATVPDDTAGTSVADDTTASSTTPPTGDEASTDGSGLPDYSDSPCWGETASTSVYDGETHMLGDVAVTCRAEGDHVLLYVADELWGSAVDQAAVNGLMHQLELFTPDGSVDPGQGVVPNDEAVFGPLDTSSFPQGKLEIYVVDTSGAGHGYLCGWCDHPQLHLDGLVLQPLDDELAVSIAAHETYHVIHRAHDTNEAMWVDESLAEAAMTANGFFTDVEWLQSFVDDPDQDWGPGDPGISGFNYGGALLWGTALWERGGAPLMTAITAEPADGWEGLDAALDGVGDPRDAWELYLDFVVAVYIDDHAIGYGFASIEVPPVAIAGELVVGDTEMGSLSPYGIDYYRLADTGELSIDLLSTGAEPVVGQLLLVGDGTLQVVPMEEQATLVTVGATESAVVVLTARDATTFTLSVS